MLIKAKTLSGYSLVALDGESIGKVTEFYFDDLHWTIRYVVVDTGEWLAGRQVLISPYAVTEVFKEDPFISVHLTKQQIMDSPSLRSDKPVSRQFEEAYYGFYQWPNYWGGPYAWGTFPYIERDPSKWKNDFFKDKKTPNPHLRSTHAVSGYRIQALDGDIGHVDDFLVDHQTWTIRYLIVVTGNWWWGKKVLISPQWIERTSWNESKVFINLRRETIKRSPVFVEESPMTRSYETRLYQHYDSSGYWLGESAAKECAGIKVEEK